MGLVVVSFGTTCGCWFMKEQGHQHQTMLVCVLTAVGHYFSKNAVWLDFHRCDGR